MATVKISLRHFRFRGPHGREDKKPSEGGAPWLEAVDTPVTIEAHGRGLVGDPAGFRLLVCGENWQGAVNRSFQFRVWRNGANIDNVRPWNSNFVYTPASDWLTHDDPTTDFYGNPRNGTYEWLEEAQNHHQMANGYYTERWTSFPSPRREFNLEISLAIHEEDVEGGDVITLKPYHKKANGTFQAWANYNVIPTFTVAKTPLPPGEATIESVGLSAVASKESAAITPKATASLASLQAVAAQAGISVQALVTADLPTLSAVAEKAGVTLDTIATMTGAELRPVAEGS